MSHEAVNWVLACSTARKGARMVLMVMADHANAEGLAWPSSALLATECNMSERQIIRNVDALVEAGQLVVVKQSKGRKASVYGMHRIQVNPDTGDRVEVRATLSPVSGLDVNATIANPDTNDRVEHPTMTTMSGLNHDSNVRVYNTNPDICDKSTLTFATSNPDICDTPNGGKGGESKSDSEPSKENPQIQEPSKENPPQPPAGGSECVGRSGVPLPKHLPEEARRIYKRYPVKEDPDAFRRAWDKRKPSVEAIAKIDALLDMFDGRTLTFEEKTHIPGPAVFVNQQRWTWDVPFKGLAIHEIASRPRERPKTVEDVQREAEESRSRDAVKRTAEVLAQRDEEERATQAAADYRVLAEIEALPPDEIAALNEAADRAFAARYPARDPNGTRYRLMWEQIRRDIYVRHKSQEAE